MAIASLENASYRIGTRQLWDSINWQFHPGVITAITGPSGSGKTTLLNCLGLIDILSAGKVLIQGKEISDPSDKQARKLRRAHIGYLFQDYALIENASVASNISLAAPPRTPRRKAQEKVEAALHKVGLGGREKEKVFRLSGGEQQRVAMARILVREPLLVLADEPTASLDRANAAALMSMLRAQADAGSSIVIVSHDPWVIEQCDERFQPGENHV